MYSTGAIYSAHTQTVCLPVEAVPNELFVTIVQHIFARTVEISTLPKNSAAYHRLYITSKAMLDRLPKDIKNIQSLDCDFISKYITGVLQSKTTPGSFKLFFKYTQYAKKFVFAISSLNLHQYQLIAALHDPHNRSEKPFAKIMSTFSSLECIDLNEYPISQHTIEILCKNNPNLHSIQIGQIKKIEEQKDNTLLLIMSTTGNSITLTDQLNKRLVAINLLFSENTASSIEAQIHRLLSLISLCPNLKTIAFSQPQVDAAIDDLSFVDLSKTKIEELDLSKYNKLKRIPLLPHTLKVLHLPYIIGDTQDINIWYKLKIAYEPFLEARLIRLPSPIEELPDLSHTQLESINLSKCYKVKNIPKLPSTLKKILLPYNIEELSDLTHTQLENIDLSMCNKLKSVPPLPSTLKVLRLPSNIERMANVLSTQIEKLNLK